MNQAVTEKIIFDLSEARKYLPDATKAAHLNGCKLHRAIDRRSAKGACDKRSE